MQRRLNDARWAIPLLYILYGSALLPLVYAANRQGILTKEEASSGFVNPTFLEFHLQHHVYSTNFYAYVYFWLTSHAWQGLFYGRFAKAALMATVPCLVYLYLRKRFECDGADAFAGALAVSLLPGIVCLAWLGIDIGIEMPLGCCALWLALFDSTGAILGSCFLAALAAESYGAGVAFLVAVVVMRLARWRRSTALGFAGMVATLLFPVWWWTNIQTLFTGGGGGSSLTGIPNRLAALGSELFIRGNSYYFFSAGAPALASTLIGVLGVVGLVMAFRRAWPLTVVAAVSLMLYCVAGNVTGVRRAQPLVLALGIFAWLLLRNTLTRKWAYLAFTLWMAICVYRWNTVRVSLADGRIPLPRDFQFLVPPGETMVSTADRLQKGTLQLSEDPEVYEPDRTLGILYVLGKPAPLYTRSEIVERCDRHGWAIPSNQPRFQRFQNRLSHLLGH